MKITFLGTGAADWDFNEHRSLEGFRRNSSILIDDCFLVDPGPNVPDALASFSKNADLVKYIINTHKHSDHYNEGTVAFLDKAELHNFSAGETKVIGKYTVTALQANHSTCRDAVHYIISDGEKKLFYGLDGAWLMYDEVAAIKKSGIDLAVLDATIGNVPGDYRIFEHNNLNMVVEMTRSLKKYVKRFMISHMARTLHTSQKELAAEMQKYEIGVAYDGLEVEL